MERKILIPINLIKQAYLHLGTVENNAYNIADDMPSPDRWAYHEKIKTLRKEMFKYF